MQSSLHKPFESKSCRLYIESCLLKKLFSFSLLAGLICPSRLLPRHVVIRGSTAMCYFRGAFRHHRARLDTGLDVRNQIHHHTLGRVTPTNSPFYFVAANSSTEILHFCKNKKIVFFISAAHSEKGMSL